MIHDDDIEAPVKLRFVRERTRIAQIPHRCSACGQMIYPGTRYTLRVELVDDDISTQKWHGVTLGECVDPNRWD